MAGVDDGCSCCNGGGDGGGSGVSETLNDLIQMSYDTGLFN